MTNPLNIQYSTSELIKREAKRRDRAAKKFAKRVVRHFRGTRIYAYREDARSIGCGDYVVTLYTRSSGRPIRLVGWAHPGHVKLSKGGVTLLKVKGYLHVSNTKSNSNGDYVERLYGRINTLEVVEFAVDPDILPTIELTSPKERVEKKALKPEDKQLANQYSIYLSVDGKILTNPEAIEHDKGVRDYMSRKGWL